MHADTHMPGLTCECVSAGTHMPQIPRGHQKTTLGSWYSPATSWDLGIELRSFRSVCKRLCPPNHPTPGFAERDLCWCLKMVSARQPCYLHSKPLSARSTQAVSQLRALHKEFPHQEEGIFPQLGNRVSLSPLTPIRKEALPQGGAP